MNINSKPISVATGSTPDSRAQILVVDDTPLNVKLLVDILEYHGYLTITASSGEQCLTILKATTPDLILLDVVMGGISGFEVCRRIKANLSTALLPIVLVTSLDPQTERINGIEAGADDFLNKPINSAELLARVKSLLRIQQLYRQLSEQAAELKQWSIVLESRVAQQVFEMERLNRLKRFLSPQIAQAVLSPDADALLNSHRKEVVVVFVDLRGFTAFSEAVAPEKLMEVLSEFHAVVGKRVIEFNATLERFTGDAIMAFLNDPISIDDAPVKACEMSLAITVDAEELTKKWQKTGHTLGIGVGIAVGEATLGSIGFDQRQDYAAIGPVTNLAARLCALAQPSQILVSEHLARMIEDKNAGIKSRSLGDFGLKGFHDPVPIYELFTERSLLSL
jgi:adenylate cyclase